MHRKVLTPGRVLAAWLLLLQAASATIVPRLSFEELTDSSDQVVSGTVTRSWAAWDAEHKYIWTHYELAVASSHNGRFSPKLEFAEPGGQLDGVVHARAGTVTDQPGESVLIFLQRMPNGYLRTTGWGQGKYTLDANRKLHGGAALKGVDMVAPGRPVAGATSLESLEGVTLTELSRRVAARASRNTTQGGTR